MIAVAALIRALTAIGLTSEQIAQVIEASTVAEQPPKRKAHTVPKEWEPTTAHISKATDFGFTDATFEAEVSAFREWEFKAGKTNFDLAFQRWLREAAKRQANGSKPINAHTAKRDNMLGGAMALFDQRNRWGPGD